MCDFFMEPPLVSGPDAILGFVYECVYNPDETSFMKFHDDGRLVTYTGYTPQYTLKRPDGLGDLLELNNTGALSIAVDRGEYLNAPMESLSKSVEDLQALNSTSGVLSELIRDLLEEMYVLSDHIIDLAIDPNLDMDSGLLANLTMKVDKVREEIKKRSDSPPALPGILDSLSALVENLLSVVRNHSFTPYVIFKGSGTEANYTLSVTKDAKISIKSDSGTEIWPNFPISS
ncbi:MAG: hypothetical protein J3Q66DRAFT_360768 [Benniella sp.]|nr:MAG: hypothetical protein J3Q66DRAFT_360768 [Benniella sp.]